MNLEILSYSAVNPGSGGAAAAAVTGDTLVVKNTERKKAAILAMWGMQVGTGWQQVIFQSGHDTTRNYRVDIAAANLAQKIPIGTSLQPEPQEVMSVTIAGSGAATELGCFLMYYEDQRGVEMQGITYDDYQKQVKKTTTVQATLTGAAAGYTGVEAINAESALLKANKRYAVLGATTSTSCGALCMSGPDFGNVRIAVPGDATDNNVCQNWFLTLAGRYGKPLIPVFNSANQNSMMLSFLQNATNISPLVTWYLGLLDD